MTANSVIASAERLIDVRHFCRNKYKMAEMSVPAWPIPIQKTKLVMSQAQPMGRLLPHTPMPVQTRKVSMSPNRPVTEAVTPRVIQYFRGVLRTSPSTIALTFSVRS